jgi:hypothetical protein
MDQAKRLETLARDHIMLTAFAARKFAAQPRADLNEMLDQAAARIALARQELERGNHGQAATYLDNAWYTLARAWSLARKG